MSKSYGNTIPIFGSEKDVKKAIMGIVSDSKGMNDPKDPDTSVIFQIHKLFLSPAEQKALIAEYKNGLPYGDAKKKLLETYLDYFADMRKKREELLKDEGYVKEVMQEGAKKAGEVAERTILKVKRAVGLL
jgi:tryptophanyl-tRNA synthetase